MSYSVLPSMIKLLPILFLVMGFTGCTIRIVDDSHDYDIDAKVISNADGECSVHVRRVESKKQTDSKAEAK